MWSISIYSGDSPFNLKPVQNNPVLTKDDVTDVRAEFVADPFIVRRNDTWYMFFEVMNADTKRGSIGVATSNDALAWAYQRLVLNEAFHLSYPYIFSSQNEYYMVPETLDAGVVCLYKADDFPSRWSCVARLLEGRFADPSIFQFNKLWWLFVCSTPYQHDTLQLYFSHELAGPWTAHPQSPIVRGDKCRARPAGRILRLNNQLFRLAQDCGPRYGANVRAFRILKLTSTHYAEAEIDLSPILTASGSGWNASGMHHVDAFRADNGRWLACVDGTP
jgi:hypothetical protein